jgi:hypothetical protein
MPLPPPDGNTFWKNYEINTPTFQLSPIEKPDMSPFLVHMTGKNEIKSIIEGKGAPGSIAGQGFLQASVPEHVVGNYDARVVCFTESPTFALDFFRYRSYRRWSSDQRYGIGFDKSYLVASGVRPVIYADQGLLKDIFTLVEHLKIQDSKLSDINEINNILVNLLHNIYPLLFPLLENEVLQGFMWEREWRYPGATGFSFDNHLIKIICCPIEEEAELRKLLGEAENGISFIRTWEEYDEITEYLRNQQTNFTPYNELVQKAASYDSAITNLNNLAQQYSIAINSLDSYNSFIQQLSNDAQRLEKEKSRLTTELTLVQTKVKELEIEKKVHPDRRPSVN